MLKHNLILILRNIKRSKVYFIINLIGLSTGLACSLLIYLWVNDELNINTFHTKVDRMYQVMEHQEYADHIMTTVSTPGILAEELEKVVPEVEHATTYTWINAYTLTSGEDNNVKAEGYHVSPNFFKTYSYDLLIGDADKLLGDKFAMAISEELALKLFNSVEAAVGKNVQLNHEKLFTVTGVFENVPSTSTEQFDFVMPLQEFLDNNEWATRWGNNGPRTVVILHEGSDGAAVSDKIAGFIKERNEGSHVTLFLKPFAELYLYGKYENGKQAGGRIEYVVIFSVIAVLILLIACINFMNLSTARASKKAKEVGIKKTVGAQRSSLITQFLAESVATAFISLALAFLLIWLVLPQFNSITEKEILLPVTNWNFTFWSIIVTLFTGLIAGSYPAFYLTGFNPVSVLKGKLPGSLSELMIRKGLVIFQFFLSIILIVSVIVISEQLNFLQSKNLGYKKENIIRFSKEGKVDDNVETFLQELKSIRGVNNAGAISHSFLGRNSNTMGVSWPGKNPEDQILFENIRVSHGLMETLGLEFVEGRPFMPDNSADTMKIIFNESAIKIMELEEPIGQVIRLWDEVDVEIIGVVKDFHFQSLHEPVNPLFFLLNPNSTWNIMVSIDGAYVKETVENLTAFYESYNPGFTFDYQFHDEQYAKLYAAEQRVSTLAKYFAGFAILISCLGLLGLSIFTAERRIREIGIRKILGSSSWNIVMLLSGSFSKIILLAILFALPVSYYILQNWLIRFAFRIDLQVWYFIVAAILALVVAWLTVASQALRASQVNPVNCLKDN